jgi:hypothetical protein
MLGASRRQFYEAAHLRENVAESREGLSWIQNYIWKNPYDYLKYIFEQAPLIKTKRV